jgi:hypothetical protein
MTLGLSQPLTEMSTRNLYGVKVLLARKTDISAICEATVYTIWEIRSLTTLWAFTASYRHSITFSSKFDN